MVDYNSHKECIDLLKRAQEAEYDNRNQAREADHFINKRDGQWEPNIIANMTGRPRYQFDICEPIIDQICGELERTDFDISVIPGSGEASKDTAEVYDGLVRNIENISDAKEIFNNCARVMITSGISGWRVVNDYASEDSFDQDLMIEAIPNFVDRVWFDVASEKRDHSDANHAWILHPLTKEDYKERYPDGSGISVSSERYTDAYFYKPEHVIVGEYLYVDTENEDIIQMSNGSIYTDDDDFKRVADDLARLGITEVKRRTRKKRTVKTRYFDNDDWLDEAQETPFSFIPVIPTYGNWTISENKLRYRGIVEKLMDPQRVKNYAESRMIEEGALAPREKTWMTPKQAKGHEIKLRTLNTNADPVQFYNNDAESPPPFKVGGPQINQGLAQVALNATDTINKTGGMFAANMGDNPGLQSGVAIERQQDKGDNGTYKYYTAQKVAISHTGRIIVTASPRVYDTKRQVQILKEGNVPDMVMLNDVVLDQQTGQPVELNNLARGTYNVVCTVGPAFQNKQKETVSTIVELAGIDESIIQIGADVLLRNVQAPGIAEIAERKRLQMVQAGVIPESQLTDEEKAILMQAAQQPQQPSPMERALIAQAQAAVQEANAKVQATQAQAAETMSKIEERNQKLMLQAQKQQQDYTLKMQELERKQSEYEMNMAAMLDGKIKTMAEALRLLREAMGADAIVNPMAIEAFDQQALTILSAQNPGRGRIPRIIPQARPGLGGI